MVPKTSVNTLRKMASISPAATDALDKVIDAMLSTTTTALGLLDSTYYLGQKITIDEIIPHFCIATLYRQNSTNATSFQGLQRAPARVP
jgi:hypothetical protein